MDQTATYDLAFVSPKRRPRTAPEIVFIIDERHLPETVDRLHSLVGTYDDYIQAYLEKNGPVFSFPIVDLFGNKEFGFGKCGYWTVEDGKVYFRLQLRPYPWTHFCSLTIFLLTNALNSPFVNEPASNQRQDVTITTLSEIDRPSGYGHAVGGWISENVLDWLKQYSKGNLRPCGVLGNVAPMHPEVIRAQQAASGAMNLPEYSYRASANHIYGWVHDTGTFVMNCYGDACDLGVYPSQWLAENCETVDLDCHNLDTADQQLTLLAGLAEIAELARNKSS